MEIHFKCTHHLLKQAWKETMKLQLCCFVSKAMAIDIFFFFFLF